MNMPMIVPHHDYIPHKDKHRRGQEKPHKRRSSMYYEDHDHSSDISDNNIAAFNCPYDILLVRDMNPESKMAILDKWSSDRLRYLYMYFHERSWERDRVMDEINICRDFLKRQEEQSAGHNGHHQNMVLN